MSNQFFQYYGGKQNMIKNILPYIPLHKCYIEPFCGGASVFFNKPLPQVSILNDLNGELVNFYRVCKSKEYIDELLKLVDCSLHSRQMHDESCEIYKNPEKYSPAQRAWAIWFNANNSFAGNLLGSFARGLDVVNDKIKSSFPTKLKNNKAEFKVLLKKLETATIECEDAVLLMKRAPYNIREMFAYIDPPYFNSDCGHYKGYSQEDFSNLLNFLAAEYKGKFLLSNYPSEILSEFLIKNKWNYTEITKNLSVNGKYNSGKTKKEVLVYNYEISKNSLF